ncbi:REG-2-like, HAD superfamily (subfamily IA) hydrolase [Stanieria cyanosphaera PCC 7437]|uniref:REG-2-like, HAD superfamily (Subfamily IA) hydrolase n=1 Tax=Stanieria cyanosphaera (strain ATCC 29371 / PCC 7437) TaxID=111780 RepID=K9XQG5_STAC7|nr:HAD family hydrolase [Stanieria cyanosphaera]AFZ34296.1 REG-2-like, HAD superfamily (subfamily IA) hydrolase [Stanieria cyanosphaera PCC 7437]
MTQPKVIFFDAVGTLFGVKGSVGEVYHQIALNFGVKTNPTDLNIAFLNSFKTAPPPIFTNASLPELSQQEYNWWYAIAKSTFTQVGVLEQFNNFDAFFAELYHYFATEQPWYIYPDVLPTLQKWQKRGVELGIISNFDTRIEQVIELLNLKTFFKTTTISSLVGAAKPDPKIFLTALSKHNCLPQQAWHIGDSFTEDYQGANQIGMKAFWLNRSEELSVRKNQLPNLNRLG